MAKTTKIDDLRIFNVRPDHCIAGQLYEDRNGDVYQCLEDNLFIRLHSASERSYDCGWTIASGDMDDVRLFPGKITLENEDM